MAYILQPGSWNSYQHIPWSVVPENVEMAMLKNELEEETRKRRRAEEEQGEEKAKRKKMEEHLKLERMRRKRAEESYDKMIMMILGNISIRKWLNLRGKGSVVLVNLKRKTLF